MLDIIVIGAGPAGLSAATNAAAEGLQALCVGDLFGGQAGHSTRIENVPGWVQGFAGPDWTRACIMQAERLGATIMQGRVAALHYDGTAWQVLLRGSALQARAVLLATGLRANPAPWALSTIRYSVLAGDEPSYAGRPVAIIGAGNSAGQAALWAAQAASEVHILARRPLAATMSTYLRDRIAKATNIHAHEGAQVLTATEEAVHYRIGPEVRALSPAILVWMAGSKPDTSWLPEVGRDENGFVVTKPNHETSAPRLFAAGDIRAGSVKRVATAVGEGAAAIHHVWHTLAGR